MRAYILLFLVFAYNASAIAQVKRPDLAEAVRTIESSTWTVEVVGETRTRQLRLGKASSISPEGGNIEAWYGWSDRTQVQVEASIRQGESGLEIKLITPAKSILEISLTGRTILEGVFFPKGGQPREVRAMRSTVSAPEEAKGIQIKGPRSELKAIQMVYMGADDCPPCRWWLSSDLVQLRESSAFRQITFNHVIKTIRSVVPPIAFLPQEVKALKSQLDQANAGTIGSPQVAIFVDGKLYDYYFGTRTATEVIAMLEAISSGNHYPYTRCLQIAYAGKCTRRPE